MKYLRFISIGIKAASFVSGLVVYQSHLPVKYTVYAGIAFAAASVLKDAFTTIGDYLDDGQRNNSYDPNK